MARVLYLSGGRFPSEVSHTLSIMRMCQALASAGNRVLLTGKTSLPVSEEDLMTYYGLSGGFEVSLFRTGSFFENRYSRRLLLAGLRLAWGTRKFFRSFKPDLVYSRLTNTELCLVPRKLPIIFEMHSLGPLGRRGIAAWVFRWIMKNKNVIRIIVTTRELADLLKAEFPEVDIRIARLSAERPVEIEPRILEAFRRDNLQGQQFAWHAGYTGYLDTIGLRGADVICKVASITPDTAFHIVGGEPHIVDYWVRYAKNYNHNKNIFFYGHRKPREMPLFLKCFDVALAPLQLITSDSAPSGMNMSPLKIPQYMSYGKAIVASDLKSHRELLTHNKTAILVSPQSKEEWSKAIHSLLRNSGKRIKMGELAKERYYEEFTPEKRVNTIFQPSKVESTIDNE